MRVAEKRGLKKPSKESDRILNLFYLLRPQTNAVNGDRRVLAWRPGVVTHFGAARRHGNFGVTHGFGISTVHAGRERAGFRIMGAVQPPEPVPAAGGVLSERLPEDLASHELCGSFIVTR